MALPSSRHHQRCITRCLQAVHTSSPCRLHTCACTRAALCITPCPAPLPCPALRPDVLDPALLRPGRLDRKIEIPLPNETARMEILKIHATKLSKHGDIDYEAVVKLAEGFNGADLRNICTEAGMFAIRDERDYCVHDDFMKAVRKLTDAKKLETTLNYDSSFGDGGQK